MSPASVPRGRRPASATDGADPGRPTVLVVPGPRDLAAHGARLVAEILSAAVARRGIADLALTGGSTAGSVYRALGEPGSAGAAVPWDRVRLWWGDDRFVPRSDPLSNAGLVDGELLGRSRGGIAVRGGGIAVPDANLRPFPTDAAIADGRGPDACALDYARGLAADLRPDADGWPVFDLVLLGIGSDGHLLSCFPGSAAFESLDWAMGIPAPAHIEPHVSRVTLNPAVVPAAGSVLAFVSGAGKAAALAELFTAGREVARHPGQLAIRSSATWVVDADAAALLPAGAVTEWAEAT